MKKLALTTSLFAMACSGPSDQSQPPIPADMPIQVEGMEDMDEEKAEEIIGSINPLENDLRGLEVAVRMHEGFRIKPDGVEFELGVIDGAGETRLDETFILIETSGIDSPTLENSAREDFFIRTFTLDSADHERMRAGDLILQELKQSAPGENQLKFNAGVYTCANPDTETPEEYRFALFVRSASDVDFIPLSNGDVVMNRTTAGPLSAAWDPCDS